MRNRFALSLIPTLLLACSSGTNIENLVGAGGNGPANGQAGSGVDASGNPIAVDANGNPIASGGNGNPIAVDANGNPIASGGNGATPNGTAGTPGEGGASSGLGGNGVDGSAGSGLSGNGVDGSAGNGLGGNGSGNGSAGNGLGGDGSGNGNAGNGAGNGSAGNGNGGNGVTPDFEDILGHPDATAVYPTYDGFTLQLVEEFNEPLDLDADPIWTWGDGALSEGLTRMVKENIAFEGGDMVLRITEDEQPGAYSFSAADNVGRRDLSSGELRTIYNNFRYGRYEVRMKSPVASNYLHTMFTYRAPAYLLWREIDIEVQASPQNTFISNIIHAAPGTRSWRGDIEESTTTYPLGVGSPIPAGFNSTNAYHVYAFEWTPTQIRWFVDGTLVRTKLDGVGQDNLPVPKESTKIVMNLWVFNSQNLGGGDPADNEYPIAANYDWFRYYKWNQETTYPCLETPGCLPDADLELAKNNAADPLPDIRPELCTGEEGDRDAPCGQ